MSQSGEVTEDLPAQVRADVAAAVARVDVLVSADPDLVPGDAVEAVALEVPLDVALELCRQTLDYVPDTVRQRRFESEHAETIRTAAARTAEQAATEQKARQRSAKAAATRAGTLAAEAAAETARIRSATCPDCFQVRSPSGVCGCD